MSLRYSLNDFVDITFKGFDIALPEATLKIINELSQQVGSPTYVKTPTFQKREHTLRSVSENDNSMEMKKKRRHKATEIVNDSDWETIRTFQTTKIEQREGVDAHIDTIRFWLNKMSDKTFSEASGQILDILNQLIQEETSEVDMLRVGNSIFEVASNNRLFSRLYADLYCMLIKQFEIMNVVFHKNLETFMELFTCIEYVDPEKDYDAFCKINSNNERRKALSLFFVNLTSNKIISEETLQGMVFNLLTSLLSFIKEENRKNEVDEIAENISILYSYNKQKFDECQERLFNGETFSNIVRMLAHSKAKTYPSLSSKSIFKFMDLIEM
uniref:MIF4G domain-containing protein n=1 Tax=viral metagenome TaxID=1070528 RepID=A0A6C0AZQ4_9ZZZZ